MIQQCLRAEFEGSVVALKLQVKLSQTEVDFVQLLLKVVDSTHSKCFSKLAFRQHWLSSSAQSLTKSMRLSCCYLMWENDIIIL